MALVALIVAPFSYFQDRDNNTAADQWQAKVLTAMEQGNQHRLTLEQDNQEILDQVTSQGQRIPDLEAVERTKTKKSAR